MQSTQVTAPKLWPASFFCPIDLHHAPTLEPMTEPVLASDGFVYERKNIEAYVNTVGYSPVTARPMTDARFNAAEDIREQMRAAGLSLLRTSPPKSTDPPAFHPVKKSLADKLLAAAYKSRHLQNQGSCLGREELAALQAQIVLLQHDKDSSFASRIGAWTACCHAEAKLPSVAVYNALQCLMSIGQTSSSHHKPLLACFARIEREGAQAALGLASFQLRKLKKDLCLDDKIELQTYLAHPDNL